MQVKTRKKANFFKIRVIQILITGLILAFFSYFLFNKMFALGVIIGLPVSIFNFWLLQNATNGIKGSTPIQAQNRFMLRALFRMLISMGVLLISIYWGIYFMLGVATGLMLQMFTYFKDAVKLLIGKG